MKIIDAHLHFATDAYLDEIAKAAEHENSADHLLEQYRMRGMVHGIVMGNLPVEELEPVYPPFLSYCIGLDSQVFDMAKLPQKLHLIEQHLRSERCVGIKLYPGYASFYLYDDRLAPIYELAARYKKPVAVHTGLTATDKALLKYSHPLVMDEAATKFREVQFVMCHFGEPWFTDAAAVIEKNPNVAADLSGLLERKIPDFAAFCEKKHFYIERLAQGMAQVPRPLRPLHVRHGLAACQPRGLHRLHEGNHPRGALAGSLLRERRAHLPSAAGVDARCPMTQQFPIRKYGIHRKDGYRIFVSCIGNRGSLDQCAAARRFS